TYQVIVQADGRFRQDGPDLMRLKARNSAGEMVPIGTVADLQKTTIPYRVPRYNLYPAAEVQGVAAPGTATGTALHRMEELASQVLPPGIGFEWTEIAFQQEQKGTPTVLIFGAAALFVFLVLAAKYESWKVPLAVVLIVPMCLLASISGLVFGGMLGVTACGLIFTPAFYTIVQRTGLARRRDQSSQNDGSSVASPRAG